MPARFELNGVFLSGPTYKVGLMLALAGEPFDYVHVNLMAGEHKQPPYLTKQRYGQVPLLVDRNNSRHLCQSAAILEYLADTLGKFGGATLDERLEAREWLYWDFDRLAPSIYRARGIRAGFMKGGEETLELCAANAASALKTLDRHLSLACWFMRPMPPSISRLTRMSPPGSRASRRCPDSSVRRTCCRRNPEKPHERSPDPRGQGRGSRSDHPPARRG